MIFFGYWSLWFLVLLFLCVFRKLKITDGHGDFSILTVIIFSLILAVPSSIIHYAFNDLKFLLVLSILIGAAMIFKKIVMNKYAIKANQMTFMEYAEQLWNGHDFDQLFDEMLRSGGYNEKTMVKYIEDMAKKNKIILTEKNKIDEDTLYEMYQTSEKGLS